MIDNVPGYFLTRNAGSEAVVFVPDEQHYQLFKEYNEATQMFWDADTRSLMTWKPIELTNEQLHERLNNPECYKPRYQESWRHEYAFIRQKLRMV